VVPAEWVFELNGTSVGGDIVVVAAEAREFSRLFHKSRSGKLDWPLNFSRLAGGLVLLANGPGPILAGRAVAEAANRTTIRALVSTGFCGALKPEFSVGDIVVADCVLDSASGRRYLAAQPPARPSARTGLIVSINRVAVTSGEKEQLRSSTGACAVEMEAGEVARWAEQLNVPFYCIRAVSDTAAHSLGLDFNAFRDQQGRFSRTRIAFAAMRNPSQIPPLRRLERDSRLAAAKLGDFLADCRF
jgi:adenosylhomocysteine nucleosidase